jgi:hypothetical protein
MKETSTRLYAYPLFGTGRIVVEFDESGWRVVEDTRSDDCIGGYLHIGDREQGDISADEITEKVRDNIIKYMYQVVTPQYIMETSHRTVLMRGFGN